MDTQTIFELVGFILINLTIIITAYINIRVKLKEIDSRLMAIEKKVDRKEKEFEEYKLWALEVIKDQTGYREKLFNKFEKANDKSHEKLFDKMDIMLEKLTNFQVYVEKKVK